MNNNITATTYIRKLDLSVLRKLSDFLDPDDRWKDVIASIHKPGGEPRYTQLHIRYGWPRRGGRVFILILILLILT